MLNSTIQGGLLLNNLNKIIGQNLSRLRKEKALSLDQLSELSNISKALLFQIERGDSNPTINTLWKISVGLHVALGDLLQEHEHSIEIIRKKSQSPLIDNEDGMRLWPVISISSAPIGIFIAELDAMHIHTSSPHDANSKEYVFILSGSLIVTINEHSSELHEGDTLCFQSDQPHSYYNPTSDTTHFQCIFYRR